jgi:hypothetical protein
VELLLQAYPEAVSVKNKENKTPLDEALKRVEKKQLSASDPLITLLKAGGYKKISSCPAF